MLRSLVPPLEYLTLAIKVHGFGAAFDMIESRITRVDVWEVCATGNGAYVGVVHTYLVLDKVRVYV